MVGDETIKRGARLMLRFERNGAHSGWAPVLCEHDMGNRVVVARVTEQQHDTDHAATKFASIEADRRMLSHPDAKDADNESNQQLWSAIGRWRFER